MKFRRHLLVAGILLAFGVAKVPVEHWIEDGHRKAYFHGATLNLGLRQQIGQIGFVAALSGFRALVARYLYLDAYTAWQRTQWSRMALLFNSVTALQPRNVMFWDMASWHMAYNASVAALEDPKQPRQALRIKAQREYFAIGKDFLERGIANNPDRWALYFSLGELYRRKFDDPCAAAEQYDKASQFPNARPYIKRFAAYELAECPGREREAYERLVALYKMGEQERLPTLLKLLEKLQAKLNVPPEERVYDPPTNSP